MSKKGENTTTAPITDIGDMRKMETIPGRDGLYFSFGLYTALRVSEIISLTFGDVMTLEKNPKPKNELCVKINKQSKRRKRLVTRTIKLMAPLRARISEFWVAEGKPPLSRYIFISKRNPNGRHMAYGGANAIVKKWLRKLEIDTKNPSTHTLRKTMARQYYENVQRKGGDALVMTMALLEHASPGTTLRYIGVTSEEVASYMDDDFYVDYSSLKKKVEKGEVDIDLIWKKVKGAFPMGPRSVWRDAMRDELRGHRKEEIAEVLDLYMPILTKLT